VILPISGEDIAALSRPLAEERDAFHRFLSILREEHDALIAGHIDPLLKLAQQKTDQFVALGRLSAIRNQVLATQGLPPDMEGIDGWLARHGSTPEGGNIARIWRELLETAATARRINQENGALIEVKLHHNQKALQILQAAADQMRVYGPSGQPLASTGGRKLGEA